MSGIHNYHRFIRQRIQRAILVAGAAVAIFLVPGFDPPAQAQMQDKTLVFGDARSGNFMGDPARWTESPHSYWLWPIYDSLAMINKDGNIQPLLATSWENVDPLTWIYKLRPNVTYQNGEPFTAKAVVDFLSWLISKDGRKTSAGQVINGTTRVASVRALDDLTIEIKTKVPSPILERSIGRFWIPEPGARADMEPAEFNKNPVGTGPYRAVKFGPEGADYEAFEGSWRPAKVARLKGLVLPDMSARRAALISGQIDIAVALSIDDIKLVEKAGHSVDVADRPTIMTLKVFQTSRESPFNDKRVRQAANYALDKEAMVEHILQGYGAVASQCTTKEAFGFNPDVKPYPYDPDKARQLLTEAGYPDGVDIIMQAVLPSNFAGATDIYQVTAQQLNEVGIRTSLEAIAFPDWLKAWFVPEDADTLGFKGPFQNNCNVFNLDGLDGFSIQSCRKKPSFYCDAEEQELLDRASSEMDPEKREKLIQELLALNAENAATIMLVQMVDIFGLHKRVQGFENHTMKPNYHEITLSD
jgi:peptide/nickel transport system substrate-binding protein